ncbi:MAG: D-2-hydroxyacid dehydrogenase [Cyclobacteriaceae bacterium]|nr:D-2-hydroxyacid dehydrogenase [Cyclobacteriaceae bacterium]
MPVPKIVVLDGHALNPGDLSWQPLQALGDVQVYPRTETPQVVARCTGAQIVLTNKGVLGQEQLINLPDLKFISVLATGVNVVDLQSAHQQGIVVSNVAGYSTYSVAQHTWGLILELTNRIGAHSSGVANGEWSGNQDWSYWHYPLRELKDKTLGIIGLGNIGKQVARIGLAMGMRVITYNHKLSVSVSGSGSVRSVESEGVRSVESEGVRSAESEVTIVSLEQVFKESDILTLHCPLTPGTKNLINKQRLSTMKPQALIINTARGPLIHEQDLKQALEDQVISGAALDVLSEEPPPQDHPLIGLSNCLVTPHQAWASWESRSRLLRETVLNVQAFLNGSPRNLVIP